MTWYKRIRENIITKTIDKKEAPDGVWYQCPHCRTTTPLKEHSKNAYICIQCDYHERISSEQYFHLILDKGSIHKLFTQLAPRDFLGFVDQQPYEERLKKTQKKTGLDDAMQVAQGTVNGMPILIAAMDFSFIGGSMGSVVGEKIALSIDHCIAHRLPLLIISRSGGARMMESAFSLMQMAKTAAKLSLLADARLPYFSLMTDPTTGGVSASFAMLGDLNLAEPKALIGFAGPRVIKETIKRDLPEGFQTAEFLLEHGFLDKIVHRKELKTTLVQLLQYFER